MMFWADQLTLSQPGGHMPTILLHILTGGWVMFLVDQLILSQPGGHIMPTTLLRILTYSSLVQTLPTLHSITHRM